MKKLAHMHPGEVLREEFLVPLNLSAGTVAKKLGLPPTRIERIAAEETGITVDTALRLARLFNTSVEFWLNLQRDYEVQIAEKAIGRELKEIKPAIETCAAA
jgi:addiction module HigA family antidote